MKIILVLFVFLASYQASASRLWGWFSDHANTDEVIDYVAETTEECRQQGRWGRCAFYTCLEERFPCGDEGYTMKIGQHFCSKIDRNFTSFDNFGQLWLNRTSICLLRHMMPIYEQESTSCAEIKAAGIRAILECNEGEVEGRDFCDFIQTNGDAYNSLMGQEEILLMASLRNPRVFSSMVSQAVNCGVSSLADKVSSLGATLTDFAGSVASRVWGWFN